MSTKRQRSRNGKEKTGSRGANKATRNQESENRWAKLMHLFTTLQAQQGVTGNTVKLYGESTLTYCDDRDPPHFEVERYENHFYLGFHKSRLHDGGSAAERADTLLARFSVTRR